MTNPVTVDSLKALLDARFGGALKSGKHQLDGECCALELLSAAQAIEWTGQSGDPADLGSAAAERHARNG